MSLKIKEFHVINAPTFTQTLCNIYQQFLKSDMSNSVIIYPAESELLYNSIPKSALPKEVGGEYKDIHTLRGICIIYCISLISL